MPESASIIAAALDLREEAFTADFSNSLGAGAAAMKAALLAVLPAQAPGFTQAEMMAAVKPQLPDALFPGGAKSGWWVKCVQLDLEAKGTMTREPTKPLRWHRS